jgi:hypothetical protein
MPRIFRAFVFVVLSIALVTAAAPAVAQEQPGNATSTTTDSQPEGERISQNLVLVDSGYDGDGTATVTLRTDSTTAVTLTDAGGFMDGGEIARKTVVLDPGTHTVSLQVTETELGYVGVSIGTRNVLYGEVINGQQRLLPGLRAEYSGSVLFGAVILASGIGVGSTIGLLNWLSTAIKKRRDL